MVEEGPRPIERATLARILGYFRPYRRQAVWVMVSVALSALAGGLPPLFIKRIVDHAIPQRSYAELAWLCAGMVVGPLLAGLLGVAHKYLAAWIGEQVMYDLRLELFGHVQRQSLAFFANAKPGEVISRVLTDVQGVGQALQDNLVKLLQNALTLTVSVVLIVVLDWRLALVALTALPLFIFPAKKVGRQRKQLKKETQARMAELTGILMETLSVSGVLLIKVFGARKRETQRLRDKAQELQAASLRQNLVGRWFQMLMKLFEDLGPALVYGVGGYLVIVGEVGLGTGGSPCRHRYLLRLLRACPGGVGLGAHDPKRPRRHRPERGSGRAQVRGRELQLRRGASHAAAHRARDCARRIRGRRGAVGRGQEHARRPRAATVRSQLRAHLARRPNRRHSWHAESSRPFSPS